MAEALSSVSKADIPSIVKAEPLKLSQGVKLVLWLMVLVGLGFFIIKVIGGDQKRAWMAFHINVVFWLMAAAAGTMFSSAIHVCNAHWARPVRRLFESMSAFLPISIVLLAFTYFGHGNLFAWVHEHPPGKEMWLTSNFVYARDILVLAFFAYLSKKVVHLSIRRDIGAIRSGLTGLPESDTGRWFQSSYDKYFAGWGSDGVNRTSAAMWRVAPYVVLVYALTMTLIAFDQIMSVDYHWFSTLFGALYFMSAIYLAFAFVSVGIHLVRNMHPLFRAKLDRKTLHDTGKLMFGFGIFWAYMFWSHYLPIWYGNLPEETGWLIVRLREEPWHSFGWMVFGLCFICPFLLGLSSDIKRTPVLLCFTGIIIGFGLWFQQHILFAPTLYPNTITLGILDVLLALSFMAGFILSCASFLEKVPLMPFGDLYEEKEGVDKILSENYCVCTCGEK